MTNLSDIQTEINGLDDAINQCDVLKATLVVKKERLIAQISDIVTGIDAIKGVHNQLLGVNQ